jgi:long-chain acyl-CoA synthetase
MYPMSRALERARHHFATRTAVVDGQARLTYAQLANRAHRLAAAMLGLGLAPGDRVAVVDKNSVRYLEIYFACAHAGLVIVPVNFRLAPGEVAQILTDAGARLVFMGSDFADLVEAAEADAGVDVIRVQTDGWPAPPVLRFEDIVDRAAPRTEPVETGPDDVMMIYYTSGTTGVPKGVCLTNASSHAGSLDGIICLRVGPDDVWLHAAPLFHMATAMLIWPLAMVGGCQVVTHFDPPRTLELMARERITMSAAPMTLFAMLADQYDLDRYDLGALRRLVYGGAPTPAGQVQYVQRAFGPKLSHVYAMTECNGFATFLDAADHRFGGTEMERKRTASAGLPAHFVDLKIVDDDDCELGPGKIGEIAVAGPKIMRGYWNRPEETARGLRNGWYYSGDIGYRDESGFVYIVDRKKDMIISGGENVYPIDVETVISKHDAVSEVAVIGIPHKKWGEAVVAIVVPRAGASVDADALITYCRNTLAGYKVPKRVVFRDEPLPKTGPGKIAKRRLRAPYWEKSGRTI